MRHATTICMCWPKIASNPCICGVCAICFVKFTSLSFCAVSVLKSLNAWNGKVRTLSCPFIFLLWTWLAVWRNSTQTSHSCFITASYHHNHGQAETNQKICCGKEDDLREGSKNVKTICFGFVSDAFEKLHIYFLIPREIMTGPGRAYTDRDNDWANKKLFRV